MKKTLLSLWIVLMAGLASAQCNPQLSLAVVSPSGNDLLRIAATNTTTPPTLTAHQNVVYSIIRGNLTYNNNAYPSPGSVSYLTASTPGTYQIGLTMSIYDSTNQGYIQICGDTVLQSITVNYTPCASTLNYTLGNIGYVFFVAATPVGTPNMTYTWNFGDGTTGTGIAPTHIYATNGHYSVTLTATSGTNCSYTNTANFVVQTIQMNCANNNAIFNSSINLNTVIFNNISSAPPLGSTVYTQWSFGDNSSSSSVSPVHTYAATGTYNVQLTSSWYDSTSSYLCGDTSYGTVTITALAPPTGTIDGNIYRDTLGSAYTDLIRVWLIRYDSTTQLLTAIDSVIADSARNQGGKYINSYHFSNTLYGDYLIKAAKLNNIVGSVNAIPTYNDSAIYWNSARQVTLGQVNSNLYVNVWMRTGTVTAGPGFIGGNVNLGANRGSSTGVPGMTILLRDQISSRVIKAAITDNDGNYSFSSVPTGLYNVYPEDMGYTTSPRGNIAITNAQNNVAAINFNEDRSKKTIQPRVPTSIPMLNGASMSLYPNPAKGAVTLSWKGFDKNDIEVIILNVTGQVVHNQHLSGTANGASLLNISRLQPGIYTVRMHSNLGDAVQKLVVQP